MSEPLVIRPWRIRWVAWIGAVLVLGVMIVVALLLRSQPTGVYFRLADQVAMGVLGLLMALGILLLAMPRVRADLEGVEVRNVLITRRVPWSDVLAVSFPEDGAWARLELPDDEYLPVLAIQAVDRERAVSAITELRALHARARSLERNGQP